MLNDDDLIALAGTIGDKTPVPDRNRILGIMEPSKIPAHTSDIPLPWGQTNARSMLLAAIGSRSP